MKLKLETLKSHKDAAQKLQQQMHNGNAQALDLEASIGVLQVCDSLCLRGAGLSALRGLVLEPALCRRTRTRAEWCGVDTPHLCKT